MLKIAFLGGVGEIGMNCLVLEGRKDMIVIDCGVMFSELADFGIEYVIPDFKFILERKEKLRAFVVTHGHEDHIGALTAAFSAGLEAPIYASRFTHMLIEDRFRDVGLQDSLEPHLLTDGKNLRIGEFEVGAVRVNHSIVDAMGLKIKTAHGTIVHTGDFKIDPFPYFGKKMDPKQFCDADGKPPLLLLSDSTNVERCEHSMSEKEVLVKLEEILAVAEGMSVVSVFASNIARVGQVLELARKMGKKVALAGRAMQQNVRLAEEAGYLKNLDNLIVDARNADRLDRRKLVLLATGSQGESRSSLAKLSNAEHPLFRIEDNDQVVLSSKFIPGNEVAISRMINRLFEQGAEVFYESIHSVHTSGHATKPELEEMLRTVNPRHFIPIHGEYRHLVHHARLARECGVPKTHVHVAKSGEVWEYKNGNFHLDNKEETFRILVEDRLGSEVSRDLLRDRRRLAESGVVFVLMSVDLEYGKLISGPEIIFKGVTNEQDQASFILDCKKAAKSVVRQYRDSLDRRGGKFDLKEETRIQIRRVVSSRTGKKTTVIPYIVSPN